MNTSPDNFPIHKPKAPDQRSQTPFLLPKSIASKIAILSLGAAALSNASCGNVVVEQNITVNADGGTTITPDAGTPNVSCDPIPYCPEVNMKGVGPIGPNQGKDYFNASGRWQRFNPQTGKATEVCQPIQNVTCADDQTSEKDGCAPPICESAKACDPIPSRKDMDGYRTPDQANFPTSSNAANALPYILNDSVNFPVIYDNSPDCKLEGSPNEKSPQGETYYSCDVIPTCPPDKIIPYCDPLPRCKEGQSPVSCDVEPNSQRYSFQDDCTQVINNTNNFLGWYRLDANPIIGQMCQPQFDPSINETFYSIPIMNVVCLPTRECADGEIPTNTFASIPMNCNGVTWTSEQYASLSCDPIKSCK